MAGRFFTANEYDQFSAALQAVETEEPVASAWRYQGGGPGHDSHWIRRLGRSLRDLVLRQGPLPRPKPSQIVVLSNGPTDATFGNLRPVMRELQRRNQEVFLITTYKTRPFLREGLTRSHVDIVRLLASVPMSERRRIKQRVADIAPELKRKLENRDGGCERWLEAGLLAKSVAKHWVEGARAVVVDADFEAVRKGFLLGAAEAGVPSLMLQHGTWGPMMFPIHATITGCWGELSRRETNDFGLEMERSVALGSPRWDHLFNQRSALSHPDDRSRCGGQSNRPLVLLISNTHVCHRYPELYEPYFEGVARLLDSPDVDVAIKLHPSEVGLTEYHKRIAENKLSRLRITPNDLGLHRALLACDVVYHVGSAASLEAMMLGVPILFEKGHQATPARYAPPLYGGGDWCGPDDVVHRVCELATPGAARDSLLQRQEAYLDMALVHRGRAARAVADYLESMSVLRIPKQEELLARY